MQDGTQCNTRILREKYGWRGIMFDNNNENLDINLHKASIWVENVVATFEKHKIPKKFDFFSLDTDMSDFW